MENGKDKRCMSLKIIEYHTCKTLLGPCFISFSLPLFIPGVVLTVVGSYGNQNTFPTFGGWHITGIVILIFASLMLFSGIILKCCYSPIITADIENHLSPTASMISRHKKFGQDNDIYAVNNVVNNRVSPTKHRTTHRVASTHDSKSADINKVKTELSSGGSTPSNGGSFIMADEITEDLRDIQQVDLNYDTLDTTDSQQEINHSNEHLTTYNDTSREYTVKKSSTVKHMLPKDGKPIITVTNLLPVHDRDSVTVQTDITPAPRDQFSDANEVKTFLSEINELNRKKRKHRKRNTDKKYETNVEHSSILYETDSNKVIIAGPEFSEHSLKPVSLNDENSRQQHNMHFKLHPKIDDSTEETFKIEEHTLNEQVELRDESICDDTGSYDF